MSIGILCTSTVSISAYDSAYFS